MPRIRQMILNTPKLDIVISICALIAVGILCILISVSFFKYKRESFHGDGPSLNDAGYTIMDDRCWLNKNVTIDTGLGMVRHPTKGRAGTCVVRGDIPANGACDTTNSVLYQPSYVSDVAMEMIDGRSECVIRMKQGLSDDDAQKYGYELEKSGQMSSQVYTSLLGKYDIALSKNARCESNLSKERHRVAYTQSQWTNQIAFDSKNMQEALDTLRVADANALSAALASSKTKQAHELSEALNAQKNINLQALQDLRSTLSTESLALIDTVRKDVRKEEQSKCLQITSSQDTNDSTKLREAIRFARQEEQDKCTNTINNLPRPQAQAVPCIAPSNQWVVVDGNLPYHEFTTMTANDVRDCANKCQANNNCTHFSFDNRQNECWLKSGAASASGEYGSQDGGGFVSGISLDKYHHD